MSFFDLRTRAMPKSPSMMSPLPVRKMFCVLRSLCRRFFSCTYLSAVEIWTSHLRMCFSSRYWPF